MGLKFNRAIVLGLVIGLVLCANLVLAKTVKPEQLISIIEPIKEKIIGVVVKNDKPISVEVSNPTQCGTPKYTTKVLGSPMVFVLSDWAEIPARGEVLYASYEGSGRLAYLYARAQGEGEGFGVKIEVDGQIVAQGDIYNMDITRGSDAWRLVKDGIEIMKEYPFRESLKVYLYNSDFSARLGGAHIEIETTD